MPSTQNAVNNHEYRSVPITTLAESPTNPRKRFDAKSLRSKSSESGRRNGSASRRRNWLLRLAIVFWLRSSSVYRLR